MTAGRINQVCMQPLPNHMEAYYYYWFAPGAHGLVNCCYTDCGWGKPLFCKGLWATQPHHHRKAQHEDIDIGASHEQNVQGALHTPHVCLDSKHGYHHTKHRAAICHPTHRNNNTPPEWAHVSGTQNFYSHPSMCHHTAPTKTHTCSDWIQTTPDAKYLPNLFSKMLLHAHHKNYMPIYSQECLHEHLQKKHIVRACRCRHVFCSHQSMVICSLNMLTNINWPLWHAKRW